MIEDIKKEIQERGDSCYFDHDFAQYISKTYGPWTITVQEMVREEAESQIADGRFRHERNRYGKATQGACTSILHWIETANEYTLDIADLMDLATFVATHRHVCVWAVLVGKAKNET